MVLHIFVTYSSRFTLVEWLKYMAMHVYISCTSDAADIWATSFTVVNLDLEIIQAESFMYEFMFDVSVTLTGDLELGTVSGDDVYFLWDFVLSHDDILDDGDFRFQIDSLSPEQRAVLQVTYITHLEIYPPKQPG